MNTSLPKIRVLHCITSLDADGAQRMLLKLCENTDAARFEHRVLNLRSATSLVERFSELGIVVTNLGMKRALPSISGLWKIRREIQTFRPDLIQGWMYHGNLAAFVGSLVASSKAILLWNIRKAVESVEEYRPLTRLTLRIGALLSRRVHGIIYCGQYVLAQHSSLGYAGKAQYVIGNGFDTQQFRPSREIYFKIRNDLGISETAPIVGMIARYHPHKDHTNFVRMAGIIAATFPELHFVLAGRGVDKNNKSLCQIVEAEGLTQRLHLLGEWERVNELLPAFDVYCLSSSAEGFPNSLGEAMSCGVPCVTTAAGAAAEVVGNVGKVVPVGDHRALAEAVREFIEMPRQEREQCGLLARERVSQNFSLRAITAEYESVYSNYYSKTNSQAFSAEAFVDRTIVNETQ